MKQWFDALRGLVFPRLCVNCDRPAATFGALCSLCQTQLAEAGPNHCEICGQDFEGAFRNAFRCVNCAGRTFDFEFAVAPYRSVGLVRRMIHHLKYDKRIHLVPVLGEMAARALEDPRLADGRCPDGPPGQEGDEAGWILVPVPLHRRRRRKRQFNQSWEIANEIAKHSNLPLVDGLVRTRYTTTQTRLAREERMKNLKGAFSVRAKRVARLRGARVLLVDDVLTTGTTAHECARALRSDAGVEKVVVVTVARG